MGKKTTGQPPPSTLLRGLEVLRCFDYRRRSLRSSEIARLIGLPQPTVWRLCKTLERAGYLAAEPEGAGFRPGLAVLSLGLAALDTRDLAELARPHLQAVADRFRGAAALSTRHRLAMLYLQRCEGARAFLNVNLRIGSEIPIASSGTGWAYLAGIGAPARQALLEQIRKKDGELWRRAEKPFQKALGEFGRTGYMVNSDIFFNGLTSVAVPLGGPDEKRLYIVNCSVLTSALAPKQLREMGAALLDVARQLEPAIPA
jgi:DNA-binding IclR family transcriptional regulator